MFPLLNLLPVSMAWWAPGSCTGQVRSGRQIEKRLCFRHCFLLSGEDSREWSARTSPRGRADWLWPSLPPSESQGAKSGALWGQALLRWGTNQLIFAGPGKWQMLARSHASSTTAPSSPCSQVLLRDTPSHITGSPTRNKSNLCDTRGGGGKEGTKSRRQSK